MNHIYKVIWNTITQTWVAVSELSRAKGKTKSSKTLNAVVLATVSAGAIVGGAEAAINYPQGTHTVNGMAIGTNSYANRNSVAYGEAAKANDGYSVAIGANAVTNRVGDDEVGVSPDRGMIAIGSNSVAKLEGATAIGSKAEAAGQQSTAVGNGAQAKGYNSSAFGEGAIAEKNYGVAVGKSANAKEQLGIAVGKNASAENYLSTAVGAKTQAKGESSIAIGSGDLAGGTDLDAPEGAKATGNASMAVGASAKATADNATALGKKATASGRDSIAAGATANASGEASAAFGESATASGKKSIATGSHASASAENAIAIGNGSQATDKAENSLVIGKGALVTAKDATVVGPVAQANGENATAVGRGAAANGTESTALGRGTKADGNQSIALGKGANAKVDSGVALGDDSVADRTARSQNGIVINTSDPSKSTGFNTENSVYAPVRLVDAPEALNLIKNTIKGNKGAVSVGDSSNTRQIINVAAGSADSDAVNVAQLKAVAGAIKHYDVVSPNGDITVTHPDPHDPNKTVWNLNLNPDRVKEITKWKLRDVDENGNTEAGKTDALVKGDETVTFQDTDTINVERDGKTLKFRTKKNIKYFSVNSSGGTNEDNKGATGDNAIAIGKDAASSANNAVVIGKSATALKNNEQYDLNVGTATSNADSAVVIGNGATSKQARTVAIGNAATTLHTSAIAIGDKAYSNGARGIAIGRNAQSTGNNSIALGAGDQNDSNKTTASAEHAVAIGSAAVANIADGIALGSKSETTAASGQTGFDASTHDGRANHYDGLNGKTLTSNLAGLSIGNGNKTRQINHLAAGKADDDAVNVAQLKSVNLAFKGDNNTKGDVRLHDQRLSVVGATGSFITTKASDNKLEINTTKSNELQFTAGAANNITTPTGLTTDKAVANAINNSGWTLQAGDKTVGLINPGDKVNIASGNGITVTPTTEANGVSKITINATVAGIQAGRNVTVETTNGVSTINAIDTNTQASVSKL
ncbi:ESPR-type extended signal peptide-containing protein, partial [Haemophilus sp. oral taxon 851]|uniref:ESPR-type extended signal peptide-containing protein n=1 Tax=Haemophilus sp. oral taxon 851 TaxID=762964 RepID=UPI00024623A8